MASTCSGLVGKTYAGATVTSSKRYESNATLATPAFCQVLATRSPYLDIEVVVPDNWSGRLWQQGGGGFDGRIPSALTLDNAGSLTALSIAVGRRGAVYAASNGGNRATVAAEAGPAVWVNGTTQGAQSGTDYAYAALETTRSFAKAVTQAFFQRGASHTYFNGCSNGGRNAYIAIQRWPDEYDGVVSGCEGLDMAGQTVAWMNMARLVGTPAMPAQAQWTAVYNAAVAACDSRDGIVDGVIANYNGCNFDVGTQQCGQPGASSDPAICLSPAQLATVRSLLGNITSAAGQTIYSGYGWANWTAPGFGGLGSGFMALATGDASWLTSAARRASFTVDTWYGPTLAGLQNAGADHDKIAIAAFIASGKKLINWHDGADGLLSLNDHARNLATMHTMARNSGLANPSDNSRFFIVPGTGHSGGSALTAVDWSDAIIKWVEDGVAPTQLVYTRTIAGGTKAMPVCQYPMYPRYTGGDVNAAASYVCSAP
nr:tannase/feruloyl esterase family alpha/beta hydrolase [Schlegelella koreensis]